MKTILTTTAFALMASTALADTITLYTSQPNADAQQTVDAFKAANPDTDVEWVRDGTTKLMARLRAEIEAGNPQPDVLLIADTVTLEGMAQAGQLAAYKSPEAAAYDDALYSADGYYYSTKLITTGIKLQQDVVLMVGAILVAALALFIDWLARLVEIAAAPKGVG